jgi:hypothetical protein
VVYAVEETPPPHWTIAEISTEGALDPYRGRIKWGPFFDSEPRTLTYRVNVPAEAAGMVEFVGTAGFDSSPASTAGTRRLFVGTSDEAGIFVTRELPEDYSPGVRFTVRLHSAPPASSLYSLFEDSPPANWVVANVRDGGWFDTAARKVRFGPFLDTLPRTVTYDVTPPATENGVRQFAGQSTLSGLDAVIVGDSELNSVPLHPADTQLPDLWLTLGEVTAYGAAWKRGTTWPAAPSPLWRGGEAYTLNASSTNAPDWWIVSTNSFPVDEIPPPIAPGSVSTNSVVTRTMPRFFTNGVPLEIRLTVTPATNALVYAVEEELPAGWDLLSASDGVTNVIRGKLRWGPFFDARTRTLTCELVATEAAADLAPFTGHGAFDGLGVETTGTRQMFRADAALAPEFTEYRVVADAGFEVTLKGLVGEVYLLAASTNWVSWHTLATLTNVTGTVKYLDSTATNQAQRFYQAVWP